MNEISMLRVPPASVEAEQAVLGGLMLVPSKLAELALSPDDFYRREHRLIFQSMLEQDGAPIDAVTLGEWFESKGLGDEIGGAGYLIQLASTTPSAANIQAYARIVSDKAMLRRLIGCCTDGVNEGFTGGREPQEIIGEVVKSLMDLSRAEERFETTLKDALRIAWKELQAAADNPGLRGVPFGLEKLDSRLGGAHKSDLLVFGARPAVGKTALLLNFAGYAAEKGFSVGLISGEQPKEQIAQRLIAIRSLVTAEKMRNGTMDETDWAKAHATLKAMASHRFQILDRSAPTLEQVKRTARRWKQQHGLQALYVDYVQRIRVPKSTSRTDEVGYAAAGLKDIARELQIPVIALAQVKRDVEVRADKRPLAGDLANSDELTREADAIVMLYRDDVYNEDSSDKGIAELNVEKNRHGPCGTIRCKWFAETMRFANLDHSA